MLKVIYCLNVLAVVGGFPCPGSQPKKLSEVVAIQIDGVPKCLGASIAAETNLRFIATAAHCVYGVQASRLSLVTSDNTVSTIQVKRVMVHPYYTPPSSDYDIALLKTNGGTKPGLFLYKNEPSSGTSLKAFYWDSIQNTTKPISATLEDRKSCRQKMANHLVVSTRMLCANIGPASAVTDGSPLVSSIEGNNHIIGVGSYHVRGGSEKKPEIFTNMANSEIYSFIDKYID